MRRNTLKMYVEMSILLIATLLDKILTIYPVRYQHALTLAA